MIVPAIDYSLSSQCFVILICTLKFICAVDHLIPVFSGMVYVYKGYNGMPLHVMEQPPIFVVLAYRASDACIYQ